MKNQFKWKISAIVAVLSCLLSVLFFVQPILGYSTLNYTETVKSEPKPQANPVNGRIAFSYQPETNGDWEIYTINPDGTDPMRLTNNDYHDMGANWSPDGTKIVFYSWRPNPNPGDATSSQIYVINSDGTNVQQLTTEGLWNYYPSWSHDGSKIAYTSTQGGYDEIYIMDADGKNQQHLTSTPGVNEAWPSWSLDDSELIYSSDEKGSYDIYKMKISTGKISQITSDANNNEVYPRLSPDGTKIVYETYGLHGGMPSIWVVDINKQNPHEIHSGAQPSWSPDGKDIVFVFDNGKIYVMNPDGTNKQRLTETTSPGLDEFIGSWSPDDSELVYSSNANGHDYDIFKINIKTGSITQITSVPENNELNPSFSPDGTKIVYDSYNFNPNEFPSIWVVGINGQNPHQIQQGDGGTDPFWSPDGKYILYQDIYSSGK